MKKKTFKHLSDADRIRIEVLLSEGLRPSRIAKRLKVNRSTISREIRNRGTPKGYLAKYAQINYHLRRKVCRPKRIIEERGMDSYVIEKIKSGWSPETIAGRLRKEISLGKRSQTEYVNPETIYQFVYDSDYGKKESLYQYLRRGKKRRTKKFSRKSHKKTIPNRIFIDQRPKEVDKRKTIGHWEGDVIHYPEKRGIQTLVERKTRYVILSKLGRRNSLQVKQAITKQLRDYPRKSLTLDNGLENTRHEVIARNLAISVFFCHPYHSWEKGSCENMNGLVRRYLPKRADLSQVIQQDLDDIAWELNRRPRKILDYLTPDEMLNNKDIQLTKCCI